MKLGEIAALLEGILNKQFVASEEKMVEIRSLLNGITIGFTQNNPEGVWKANLDEQDEALELELPLDLSAILPK